MCELSTYLLLAGAVLVCLFLATVSFAGKGSKGGSISLSGKFRDAGANFAVAVPDRISSDCRLGDTADPGCPYVNGVDNVEHAFDSNGNLALKLNTKNVIGPRSVTFDFSSCVSPGQCRPPFSAPTRVSVIPMWTYGDTRLGTLSVGQEIADLRWRMVFRAVDPEDGVEKDWVLVFRFDSDLAFCSGASDLAARHPDADTWEIEADATDVACLHAGPRPKQREFHGLYHMPFLLRSVRK